jgi:hypothetical protein
MGTRCLTVFKEQDGSEIAVMYRQFDGYPDGHGRELADFLKGKKIVNGLSCDTSMVFNGMGCLSASVVAHFKDRPGDIYLHAAGTRDVWEEYVYIVSGETGAEPKISVVSFDGPASQYGSWLEQLQE